MVELFTYANNLAEQRRADPRDDIVTKLLNAEIDGDKLSELEFDMFMLLLAVAGNETTRNATAHGMYALLTNPEQFDWLKEDPAGRIDIAVEEILRWASPVLHFKRTVTADTEIRGQEIKEGDAVVMWYISANRDEDVFDDPFRFDLTRDPNPQIAFGGGGNHFCLGANLARTELKLMFEEIATRLPDMQLAGEPDRLRSNFIGGIKHLPVTWTPGKRVLPAERPRSDSTPRRRLRPCRRSRPGRCRCGSTRTSTCPLPRIVDELRAQAALATESGLRRRDDERAPRRLRGLPPEPAPGRRVVPRGDAGRLGGAVPAAPSPATRRARRRGDRVARGALSRTRRRRRRVGRAAGRLRHHARADGRSDRTVPRTRSPSSPGCSTAPRPAASPATPRSPRARSIRSRS